MTEAEYRRLQEYILEADVFRGQHAHEAYGLAWLAYRYTYGDNPGRAPLPAAWGLFLREISEITDTVDTLIAELHNPAFDRDPPGP